MANRNDRTVMTKAKETGMSVFLSGIIEHYLAFETTLNALEGMATEICALYQLSELFGF